MKQEGPRLETLVRRLEDCPPEFLQDPFLGKRGTVHVDAVVADLLRDWGTDTVPTKWLDAFCTGSGKVRDEGLRTILLAVWVLRDPWFAEHAADPQAVVEWLAEGLDEVSGLVPAGKFVNDPERREELARRILAGLGMRPAGETVAQALDRLSTINSVERRKLIRDARAAEERSRALREALARRAAHEAADKWNRE